MNKIINILKTLNATLFLCVGLIGYTQDNKEQQTLKFNLIDADDNEVITIREMIKFYEDKIDIEGKPIDAKKLFYGLDANENSIVTINEFIKGVDWKLAYEFVDKWSQKPEIVEQKSDSNIVVERQTKKFAEIDANFDEELTIAEMVDFHKGMINKKTGKLINGKLKFYASDHNSNDVITISEFLEAPDWKKGSNQLKELDKKSSSNDEDPPGNAFVNKRIKLYYVVDADGNFKVTKDELAAYYKEKVNNAGKPVNAELRFFGLDINEDDYVDMEEFTKKIDFKYASKRLKDSTKEK